MKHEIIKTNGYLLIVDDSEIKTWYYDNYTKKVHHSGGAEYSRNDITKNIVAHLPLDGYAPLKEVPLLPSLEDDVEKLAFDYYDNLKRNYYSPIGQNAKLPKSHKEFQAMGDGFIDGYNKAKESERNNLTPFKNLITLIENGLLKGTIETNLMIDQEINICKEYLNKQSQSKTPTHFEVDMRENGFFDRTNSQGQIQIVGKYIYE